MKLTVRTEKHSEGTWVLSGSMKLVSDTSSGGLLGL